MKAIVLAGFGIAVVACSDASGPSGPPRILQVFARERVPGVDDDGNAVIELEPRLAFGDHPDIAPDADDRDVTAAVARDGQKIRVVVDRLLRGNDLEEVACADGTWSRVPNGATFDDVAACAGTDLSRCSGICVGANGPVGILDENHDGAFDDTRLIEGAVILTCDGANVPLDLQKSFYQPSGDQLISAGSVGLDSLGPAIVIAPQDGMKPNAKCGIAFASSVVDKADDTLCAPTSDGAGCTPGDTSAIHFGVEPFLLASSEPADGAMDVALTDEQSADATITVQLNAKLDDATVASAIEVTADGAPVTGLTPVVSDDDDAAVTIAIAGGFKAATTYSVTVTGIEDAYGDSADASVTFTTKGP